MVKAAGLLAALQVIIIPSGEEGQAACTVRGLLLRLIVGPEKQQQDVKKEMCCNRPTVHCKSPQEAREKMASGQTTSPHPTNAGPSGEMEVGQVHQVQVPPSTEGSSLLAWARVPCHSEPRQQRRAWTRVFIPDRTSHLNGLWEDAAGKFPPGPEIQKYSSTSRGHQIPSLPGGQSTLSPGPQKF